MGITAAGQRGGGAAEPMGFYTDTTVCIGCKACEVACKEWNQLPAAGGGRHEMSGDSYDNTRRLDGTHWRHVKFIEQFSEDRNDGRWLMMSDVCKHCVNAPCLEVCPTGAIIRTEFDTVVIQSDTCNGCRACIAACPFGVIDINRRLQRGPEVHPLLRPAPGRHGAGVLPGLPHRLDPVRHHPGAQGDGRSAGASSCTQLGENRAHLYGADDKFLGGLNSFYLLVDQPRGLRPAHAHPRCPPGTCFPPPFSRPRARSCSRCWESWGSGSGGWTSSAARGGRHADV